jgi:hypothetical protein
LRREGYEGAISFLSSLTGTARLRFWARPNMPPRTWRVVIPMTSPRRLNRGPPEFPGETGTDIWIQAFPSYIRRADTRPSVRVCSSPSGLPMEMSRSPTTTVSESPRISGFASTLGPASAGCSMSMESSARSTAGESTSRSAVSKLAPLWNRIWIVFPCSITWWLVAMVPLVSIRNPVPLPSSPGLSPLRKRVTTDGASSLKSCAGVFSPVGGAPASGGGPASGAAEALAEAGALAASGGAEAEALAAGADPDPEAEAAAAGSGVGAGVFGSTLASR